jgi:hypothetical protein
MSATAPNVFNAIRPTGNRRLQVIESISSGRDRTRQTAKAILILICPDAQVVLPDRLHHLRAANFGSHLVPANPISAEHPSRGAAAPVVDSRLAWKGFSASLADQELSAIRRLL